MSKAKDAVWTVGYLIVTTAITTTTTYAVTKLLDKKFDKDQRVKDAVMEVLKEDDNE